VQHYQRLKTNETSKTETKTVERRKSEKAVKESPKMKRGSAKLELDNNLREHC